MTKPEKSRARPATWAVEASRLDGLVSLVIDPTGQRLSLLLDAGSAWRLMEMLTSPNPLARSNERVYTTRTPLGVEVNVCQVDPDLPHHGQALTVTGGSSGRQAAVLPPLDVTGVAMALGALGRLPGARTAAQKARAMAERMGTYELAVDNSVARARAARQAEASG